MAGPGGLANLFCDVKNKRNGGSHKVDENDDNTFIYIYVHLLFIHYFF